MPTPENIQLHLDGTVVARYVINDIEVTAAPEFQTSWFVIYLEYLESKNLDPTNLNFTFHNGNITCVVIPEKSESGEWSYRFY